MFRVKLASYDSQQWSMSTFDGRGINETMMMGVIAAESQSSNCCKKPNSGLVVMAANHTKHSDWRGSAHLEYASSHHEMETILSFSTAQLYTR